MSVKSQASIMRNVLYHRILCNALWRCYKFSCIATVSFYITPRLLVWKLKISCLSKQASWYRFSTRCIFFPVIQGRYTFIQNVDFICSYLVITAFSLGLVTFIWMHLGSRRDRCCLASTIISMMLLLLFIRNIQCSRRIHQRAKFKVAAMWLFDRSFAGSAVVHDSCTIMVKWSPDNLVWFS